MFESIRSQDVPIVTMMQFRLGIVVREGLFPAAATEYPREESK